MPEKSTQKVLETQIMTEKGRKKAERQKSNKYDMFRSIDAGANDKKWYFILQLRGELQWQTSKVLCLAGRATGDQWNVESE